MDATASLRLPFEVLHDSGLGSHPFFCTGASEPRWRDPGPKTELSWEVDGQHVTMTAVTLKWLSRAVEVALELTSTS